LPFFVCGFCHENERFTIPCYSDKVSRGDTSVELKIHLVYK